MLPQTYPSVIANGPGALQMFLDVATLILVAASPILAFIVARLQVNSRFKQLTMELEHKYRAEILSAKLEFYATAGRAFQDLVFKVSSLNRIQKGKKLSDTEADEYWQASKDFHRIIAEGWHIAPSELLEIAHKMGMTIGKCIHYARKGVPDAVFKELDEGYAPLFDEFRNCIRKDIGLSVSVDFKLGDSIAELLNVEDPSDDKT